MTRKRMKATKLGLSQSTDDLTRIYGIGPAAQKLLNSSGIQTYAQLAALSPAAIAAIVPPISINKIKKENWTGQAHELASSQPSSQAVPDCHQHYENFTLEFLLDEKNKIRRMQIISVQSGDIDTLTRWEPERLIDFLAHHTGMRLRYAKSSLQNHFGSAQASLPHMLDRQYNEASTELIQAPLIKQAALQSETSGTPAIPLSVSTHHEPPIPAVSTSTINQIRVLEWKTCLANTHQPASHLNHDEAFNVSLIMDLSATGLPKASPLSLNLTIYAKKLGTVSRQTIAETRLTRPYASIIELTIENAKLDCGFYRLEALLIVQATNMPAFPKSGISTSIPGSLMQVY